MNTLRQRIEALSSAQQRLLARRLADTGNAGSPGAEREHGNFRQTESTKRLVAYIVFRPSSEPADPQGPVEWLRRQLPDYMLPESIVALEQLPRTPNGKVDQYQLPDPHHEPAADAGFVAPRNDVENRLAGLWCEVLALEVVGVHDGFYEVGGDSLMSIRLIARIREEFQCQFDFQQFSRNPTIAGIAEYLALVDWLRQEGDASVSDDDRDEFTI